MTHKVRSICSLAVFKKIFVNHPSKARDIFKGLAFLSPSSMPTVLSEVSPRKPARPRRTGPGALSALRPGATAAAQPKGISPAHAQRSHPPAGRPPAHLRASHLGPCEIPRLTATEVDGLCPGESSHCHSPTLTSLSQLSEPATPASADDSRAPGGSPAVCAFSRIITPFWLVSWEELLHTLCPVLQLFVLGSQFQVLSFCLVWKSLVDMSFGSTVI